MLALDASSRRLLAAVAFAAFGAAFVTTPIVARGEPGSLAEPAAPLASPLAQTRLADVVPRRDPFAGGETRAARPSVTPAQTTMALPAIPALPQIPAALRALPPNAGAGDGAFPFATAPRSAATVTAVITGPHPFALVDEAGTTRVLTIGDRIDGDSIASISTGGVRLSDGTTLPVAPASGTVVPAPPATIVPHRIFGGRLRENPR